MEEEETGSLANKQIYEEALKAAYFAVAETYAPIQGTPYIAGPNKFCQAISRIKNPY